MYTDCFHRWHIVRKRRDYAATVICAVASAVASSSNPLATVAKGDRGMHFHKAYQAQVCSGFCKNIRSIGFDEETEAVGDRGAAGRVGNEVRFRDID
jgi:hypothetical protein